MTIKLIALHDEDIDLSVKENIKQQCMEILNKEWPRSETLRLRSLESSRPGFPMCLALLKQKDCDKKDKVEVIGHVKLSRIPSRPDAVWIESVVIHPDLRGKGIGKYLMLKTEEFCRDQEGFRTAYLCTIDKQIFYSRCGYRFCEPVTASSGKVMNGNLFFRGGGGHLETEKKEEVFECSDKELGRICDLHFQIPSLPDSDPEIPTPLRKLKLSEVKKSIPIGNAEINRITVHKDFMKKDLYAKPIAKNKVETVS